MQFLKQKLAGSLSGVFVVLMCLLVLGAVPMQAAGFPVVIVDGLGREIRIDQAPQRLIALAPSVTENLYALGLGDRVVGVSDYSNYPPEAQEKPIIGDALHLNFEQILILEPDLIIGDAQLVRTHIQKLDELGLPVLAIDPANVHEVMDAMLLLGEATGAQEEAQEVVAEMKDKVRFVQDAVGGLSEEDRLLVFVEIWDEPLMTCGPGSFMQELIELAGGRNLAADAPGAWVEYSSELVVERDPDVILLTWPYEEEVMNRTAWQTIKAVKQGRVVAIDSEPFVRTTPRLADALVELAKILHPERF
ncbi:MAG: ABC transporter substrate-binding protein [Firmicutes bacterium]|jgi:iron complex transport system substrate-binding protein|nr:ABC transporter substrate-binding protein [Bacillota bacterium]